MKKIILVASAAMLTLVYSCKKEKEIYQLFEDFKQLSGLSFDTEIIKQNEIHLKRSKYRILFIKSLLSVQ